MFLPARDKLTPRINLRQLEFTYNVCGPFTKHVEKGMQKFKERGDSRYLPNMFSAWYSL